jgi:hypothetical protein
LAGARGHPVKFASFEIDSAASWGLAEGDIVADEA